MTKPTWAHVEADSEEWHKMWAALVAMRIELGLSKKTKKPDYNEMHPSVCGESWQYGSTHKRRGKWVHEFRHRNQPRAGRIVLAISASKGWQPEEE